MARGDNCRTGCRTRDHLSWGECARAASLKIGYCGQGGGDKTSQQKWDSELNHYYGALAQGVEPEGTTRAKVDEALKISEKTGVAYNANASGHDKALHKAVAKASK